MSYHAGQLRPSHRLWRAGWLAAMMCFSPAMVAENLPRVWIFSGLPGDVEHHREHESILLRLKKSFQDRYGIPAERLTVLYGPQAAGYDGECTKELLLAELGKAAASTHEKDAGPVWLIFQGHANPVPGSARFNLPGPDVTPRDLARALAGAKAGAPMVILATTTSSGPFLRPLAAPGRVIITATSARDPEDETEFPRALADVLENPESDADDDGLLSVTEIFLATHARVLALYQAGGYMVREHAQLDGDGDGKGTRRPAEKDAAPASRVGLRTAANTPVFE